MIHVAGTNGKGSTCAFLRAIAEAAGLRVHVYHLAASGAVQRAHPHRRQAGRSMRRWRTALEHVERVNAARCRSRCSKSSPPSHSNCSRARPRSCACWRSASAARRCDQRDPVGRRRARSPRSRSIIATCSATRCRRSRSRKPASSNPACRWRPARNRRTSKACCRPRADAAGARLLMRGRDWWAERTVDGLRYEDAHGARKLPPPSLTGPHQIDNAGIALARSAPPRCRCRTPRSRTASRTPNGRRGCNA